jgi:two-component system KDP operon response regulator KdpE
MNEGGTPILVAVIEDDPAIRHLLKTYFEGTSYRVVEAESAREGLALVAERRPDVILLDLGLPDGDGVHVITNVRQWSSVPIIVISGRGQEEQKIACLEAGADDYVTKPFGVGELMARVKVALRHAAKQGVDEPVFEAADLKMDFAARRVWVREEEVHLTPLEYKILSTLVQHAGKVVTHRQLLTEVWGAEYSEEAQYLRVYMGYLRKKLEASPDKPQLLLTEPRVGYRLCV